jgi:hypothetical protein
MGDIPIAGLFLTRARIPHKSDDPFLFNFAQTSRGQQEQAWMQDGAGGNGELPMKDAQRYRMNAAECRSAAERCGPAYRDLTLAIAASWLSLARHQEAMDELLAIWSKAQSAAPIRLPFQFPRDPPRDRTTASPAREAISA